MADVRATAGTGRPAGRDRGQLVLVTALALASLFVVLALVLNAVIYTGNFATRSHADDDVQDALQVRAAVAEELERAVDDVNRNASNGTDLHASLAGEMATWNELVTRHRAADARDLQLAVSTTNGTRVVQENDTRTLTNAAGTADWELVPDADGVQAFRLNASPSVTPTNASNATAMVEEGVFRVVVTNGSDQWTVFVYRDGGTAAVAVQDQTGTLAPACSGASAATSIDLVAGTVDGASCDDLAVVGSLTDVDVAYRSGDNATGTYTLVVAQREGVIDDGDFVADDSASPFATKTIYEASVEVRYHSPTVAYRTTVSVAPEAADG